MAVASTPHAFSLDAFQRLLVYERQAPAAAVLADLDQLQSFDKAMEREESRWKSRTVYTIVGLVLCIVGMIASFATEVIPLGLLLGAAVLGALVGAIYCGAKWSRFGKFNLEDRRFLLPRKVLSYLTHDMAPDQPLVVRLDFRPYRDAAFLKGQSAAGMFTSQRSYQYVVPWLVLRGQLLDGQRFELELTTIAKRKEKRKRKYTKVRESFHERLQLALRVKPARFPQLAQLAQRVQAAQVPMPFAPTGLRAEDGVVTLVGATPVYLRGFGRGQTADTRIPDVGVCTADHALQAFLATYSGLELCRK